MRYVETRKGFNESKQWAFKFRLLGEGKVSGSKKFTFRMCGESWVEKSQIEVQSST